MPSPSIPPEPTSTGRARLSSQMADRIAFTLWVPPAIGFVLAAAVGRVLHADEVGRWALIAAAGSAVVYGIDRLRDLERDRRTSPRRTAFIERNARVFRVALVAAAALLAIAAVGAPPAALALCGLLGVVGLLHRRLKGIPALKSLYVSFAWTGVCVGLPWLATPDRPALVGAACAAILFPTFWANLVASNLRDDEAQIGPETALSLARAALVLALAVAWLAPTTIAPLAWIPAAELLALFAFRPTEHYGHLGVDGALLAGGLATLVHLRLS